MDMDAKKIEKAQAGINKYLDWAKQNTILVGLIATGLPAFATFSYNAITELNKAKESLSAFTEIVEEFPAVKRKADALQERVNAQQETIAKLSERLADAYINSKESKTLSESTQKEMRSLGQSQEVQLKSLSDAMRMELNAIKRANTNRLGQ